MMKHVKKFQSKVSLFPFKACLAKINVSSDPRATTTSKIIPKETERGNSHLKVGMKIFKNKGYVFTRSKKCQLHSTTTPKPKKAFLIDFLKSLKCHQIN